MLQVVSIRFQLARACDGKTDCTDQVGVMARYDYSNQVGVSLVATTQIEWELALKDEEQKRQQVYNGKESQGCGLKSKLQEGIECRRQLQCYSYQVGDYWNYWKCDTNDPKSVVPFMVVVGR